MGEAGLEARAGSPSGMGIWETLRSLGAALGCAWNSLEVSKETPVTVHPAQAGCGSSNSRAGGNMDILFHYGQLGRVLRHRLQFGKETSNGLEGLVPHRSFGIHSEATEHRQDFVGAVIE